MQLELTTQQKADQATFRAFVDETIVPHANRYDQEGTLPESLFKTLAQAHYLVATLPPEAGGLGLDMLTYGLLTEEIGRGCGSVRNLIAVQGMVAHAILKWGTLAQKEKWVAKIGQGEAIAAFALSEPTIGSDAGNIVTSATLVGNQYI